METNVGKKLREKFWRKKSLTKLRISGNFEEFFDLKKIGKWKVEKQSLKKVEKQSLKKVEK